MVRYAQKHRTTRRRCFGEHVRDRGWWVGGDVLFLPGIWAHAFLTLLRTVLRVGFGQENVGGLFFKKGIKKNKIRKRGASWRNLGKWVPPAR
jgi:hypothetical protein